MTKVINHNSVLCFPTNHIVRCSPAETIVHSQENIARTRHSALHCPDPRHIQPDAGGAGGHPPLLHHGGQSQALHPLHQ